MFADHTCCHGHPRQPSLLSCNEQQPKLGFGINVKIPNNDVQNIKVGVDVRV